MKASAALALRYIKMQKKHSLFIVICVALSVALTAFSLTAFSTIRNAIKQTAEGRCGTWEACIDGLTEEQAMTLSHNAAFSNAEYICFAFDDTTKYDFGYGYGEDGKAVSHYFRRIRISDGSEENTDEQTWLRDAVLCFSGSELMPKMLVKGSLPQNDGEIVVPEDYSLGIGDRITITGDVVMQYIDEGIISSETILDSKTKEYTVCGITQAEPGMPICFLGDSFFMDDEYSLNGYRLLVKFSDTAANYRSKILEVCESAGIDIAAIDTYYGDVRAVYSFYHDLNVCWLNDEYLKAAALGSEARSDLVTYYALMYVVVLLILAAGRMIIDCEFELSSAKTHKQLGLIMSIGATDRQLVEITVIQALILGIIAVPLGLLLGYIFAAAALAAVMSDKNVMLFFEQSAGHIGLSVSPVLMCLAGITGIGWVFFSSYGTAVRIKKVNPIEAVRGMRKKGRLPYPKKRSSDKVTPRRFIKSMAVSTMKIERKRFIVSALAMTVSIVFFTVISFSVNTALELYRKGDDYDRTEFDVSDFVIYSSMNNDEIRELADKIDGCGYLAVPSKILADSDRVGAFVHAGDVVTDDWGNEYHNISMWGTIYSLSREKFETLFPDSSVTYDEALENRNALIFRGSSEEEMEDDKNGRLDGDHVVIEGLYFNDQTIFGDRYDLFLELDLICEPYPAPAELPYEDLPSVNMYVPEEIITEYKQRLEAVYPGFAERRTFGHLPLVLTDTGKYAQALDWLEKNAGEYYYKSYYDGNLSAYTTLRVTTVIGYAVVIVAALIAVSNIVNITVSGITENKQGFALLRAAGMTDRQLEKTAAIQSLIPAGAAALAALVISAAAIILVCDNIVTAIADITELYAFDFSFVWFSPDIWYAVRQYIIAAVCAGAVSLISGIGPVKEIESLTVAEAVKVEE